MYTHNVYIFGATRLCSHGKRSKGTRKKLEFSSQRFDKVGMKWLVFGTWNTRFSSARRGIKMLRYSFLLFIPLRERERERRREMPAIEFQFLYKLLYSFMTRQLVESCFPFRRDLVQFSSKERPLKHIEFTVGYIIRTTRGRELKVLQEYQIVNKFKMVGAKEWELAFPRREWESI